MENIRVYVVNHNDVHDEFQAGCMEQFISEAERQGTVYSVDGFENALNDDTVNITNSSVRFFEKPTIEPDNNFKALFNPLKRYLLVKYGNTYSTAYFDEIEEWAIINYNNSSEDPRFLHVQLDYDETMQLIFYPRIEGEEGLNESLSKSWDSLEGTEDSCIKIANSDFEWDVLLVDHMGLSEEDDYYRTAKSWELKECRYSVQTKKWTLP